MGVVFSLSVPGSVTGEVVISGVRAGKVVVGGVGAGRVVVGGVGADRVMVGPGRVVTSRVGDTVVGAEDGQFKSIGNQQASSR